MKNIVASKGALKHNDYGARYSKESTFFRLWAPTCSGVKLAHYHEWNDYQRDEHPMERHPDGTWTLKLQGDLAGHHYTYIVEHGGDNLWREVVDPYATGSAPNSKKAMIVDFNAANPAGWLTHLTPEAPPLQSSILYELHIRDFTVSEDSGVNPKHRGLYLGLAESGTKNGLLTSGLDHLVELGVTHVHLMPVFDFKSVDEILRKEYNWGYDPVLFNVPEGSYATVPYGNARITELKQLIMTLHEKGLRVIMDVVYNHTFQTDDSNFNRLVPDYYYRMINGNFSNGSGCGNELDTEKPMVRKFIIDSLKFWMQEYRVDGFRFDLMGLYDTETVTTLAEELRQIDPKVILYGEPWTGGDSALHPSKMFVKGRQKGLGIALFNDDYRNILKGDNDGHGRGLINGHIENIYSLKRGLCGEIDYSKEIAGFAASPDETIQYICAHDNLILRDKIEQVTQSFDTLYLTRINRLAFTLLLTSFGIPFIHEGTEIYRSKSHNHNSYNAPDLINEVLWNNKDRHYPLFVFVKNLIAFRRDHQIFDQTAAEIKTNLAFYTAKGLHYSIIKGEWMYHFHHNFAEDLWEVDIPADSILYVLNDQCIPHGFHSGSLSTVSIESKSSLIYSHVKPIKSAKASKSLSSRPTKKESSAP